MGIGKPSRECGGFPWEGNRMDQSLPGLMLTGASGFVGRNFIKAATGRFRLFCLARRSMEEAGVQQDDNLRWIQVDIADEERLRDIAPRVREHGGVDYVVNLAGYYDFTNEVHYEYVRTNVRGTKNMLELARELKARRFVFASSQAACPFGEVVTEETPPTAEMPYAQSKRAGEELVREYAQWFPCAIVRIAAVFSDWCEYPPLYTLLNNWCSGKFLESRLIGGRGQTAVPYIHVQDLVQCFLRVIDRHKELDRLCIFNAGPDGTTTHLELFRIATQFYYNRSLQPLLAPKWLLRIMIMALRLLGHFQGKEVFERLWMVDYIDQQLIVDSSRTRRELGWQPTPRKTITRRLLFLLENMRRHPDLWRNWNEAMLHKAPDRPNLVIHKQLCQALHEAREVLIEPIVRQLLDTDQPGIHQEEVRTAGAMDRTVLQAYVRLLYQLVVTVMRTRNRPVMQQHAHAIAFLPMMTGFGSSLASHCLFVIGELLIERFRNRPEFHELSPGAEEYVAMTIHLAIDRIEDQAELARAQSSVPIKGFRQMALPEAGELDRVTARLEQLGAEAASGKPWARPQDSE